MKYRMAVVLLILSGFVWGGAARAENFRVGVAPHSSPRVILALYQPLREALQQALGMPVEIATASDFTDFARKALAFDYDIAVTTAHQAALLRDDAGFIPLATYLADFESLVVTARDSGIRQAVDLNGRAALGLSPSSLVTLWGLGWMQKNHVEPKSVGYITASDSVAQQLLNQEAAVGFMSLPNFEKLKPDVQARLTIFARSGPMPGRVYLLSPQQSQREKAVREALAKFAASEAGRRYFADNLLGGYRPVPAAELDAMRPYAAAVRKQLKGGQ